MADSAVVNLPAATLATGSYLYVVTDPTGTPADERISVGGAITFIEANLATPSIATSVTFDGVTVTGLTGVDATIVTGTAGTDGQIATWNADGDIVGVGTATAGTVSAKTTPVDADTVLIFDSADSNALKKVTAANWVANYVAAEFPAASDTVSGRVELATTAETTTGTDATKAVTPDGLRDATHTGLILADPKAQYAENAQTGTTYTLALTDHGRGVSMANASAQTLTIPTNASVAFPVGAMIPVVSKGAGVLTITASTGVTLNGVASPSTGGAVGTPASGVYTGVTLWKVGTDAWYAVGDIAAVS